MSDINEMCNQEKLSVAMVLVRVAKKQLEQALPLIQSIDDKNDKTITHINEEIDCGKDSCDNAISSLQDKLVIANIN